MRRVATNTVCLLVVLTSYLWGGCFACDQFYMVQGTPDCCHHGKCDRTSHDSSDGSQQSAPTPDATVCEQMPWSQADPQGPGLDAALHPAALLVATPAPLLDPSAAHKRLQTPPDPAGASPPDLPVLHASLLI